MFRFRRQHAFPIATFIVLLGTAVHSRESRLANVASPSQTLETKYEVLARSDPKGGLHMCYGAIEPLRGSRHS